jgi:glycosyltransferase involved in cell wall biosynthesis
VIAELVATTALAVWLYLLLARGAFWRCTERDDQEPVRSAVSGSLRPCVAAVVPARNEADCIGKSVGSLLAQDYRGAWTVILVDDDSSDGTADIARRLVGADEGLRVVTSRGLPAGWTGKLWALKQGIDAAMALPRVPDYLLLTDADIVHAADSVSRLVARAEAMGTVLTSLMVKLRCELGRARQYSGFHLFLPSLSVLLREIGRRARSPRPAVACWSTPTFFAEPAASRSFARFIDDCAGQSARRMVQSGSV